jgi:transposase-like protein
MQEKISLRCPYCNSKNIKKEGKRKSKLETIQKFSCKNCNKNFTDKKLKQKTYPAKIILNAISTYNLGYSQQQTSKIINQKFKIKVPQRTISEWVNQFKQITTFNKLRKKAKTLYPPEQVIEKHEFLHNNLPYTFQFHKAKLEILFKDIKYNNQFINQSKFYGPIKTYLEKITTKNFPHHIFKQKQSSEAVIAQKNILNKNNIEQRASQLKFKHLKIKKLSKTNLANKLTKLALNLSKTNKDRHDAIQNFI